MGEEIFIGDKIPMGEEVTIVESPLDDSSLVDVVDDGLMMEVLIGRICIM